MFSMVVGIFSLRLCRSPEGTKVWLYEGKVREGYNNSGAKKRCRQSSHLPRGLDIPIITFISFSVLK